MAFESDDMANPGSLMAPGLSRKFAPGKGIKVSKDVEDVGFKSSKLLAKGS